MAEDVKEDLGRAVETIRGGVRGMMRSNPMIAVGEGMARGGQMLQRGYHEARRRLGVGDKAKPAPITRKPDSGGRSQTRKR
jgi:hypothetical protein